MKKAAALILTVVVLAFVAQISFAASADAGKTTFTAKCAVCHGADVQKKSDADLASFVADGGGKPTHAYKNKGLTDDQIKDTVAFIRTLKK